MQTRTLAIAGFGLVLALGIPLYYVVIKKRASASLDDLLAERFHVARGCPVGKTEVPEGGRITCLAAYEDAQASGTWLVLGSWDRGTVRAPQGIASVENRVSGIFKHGGDDAWVASARQLPDVIAATTVEGGALVWWKGLPSRDTVLAHVEAVR